MSDPERLFEIVKCQQIAAMTAWLWKGVRRNVGAVGIAVVIRLKLVGHKVAIAISGRVVGARDPAINRRAILRDTDRR